MNVLPDKSSRRRFTGVDPQDDAPIRIVLDDDPALLADSHASTVELAFVPGSRNKVISAQEAEPISRGSSSLTDEEKTVISKRAPVEEAPPSIHIGPLESRKALEGETLDHYTLESYVGGGGMGAVYRSHDARLNRLVAVKILSRDQSDSETVRRFRNEAQSAARLDHPHIARVYYIGEDKGWNFIVFEFIEGQNLREIVEQRGPLPLHEALDYTLQVAEALDHASARDVVHRDIKPSNVLVAAESHVKLVDMGLARLHQVESGADDLTQSGVTLGTFDYISPEQARDPRLADVRSDIYSLGCTLYFMLVGRPPFPDGTALQKLLRHNGDDPPDVRLFRPDTPDDVVAILARALAKRPDQRFQSPAELMLAINRVSQRLHLNLGTSSSRMPIHWPPAVAVQTPWWQRFAPLAMAALVLLVLAFLPDTWSGATTATPSLPSGVKAAVPSEEPSIRPIPPEVIEPTSTSPPKLDSQAAIDKPMLPMSPIPKAKPPVDTSVSPAVPLVRDDPAPAENIVAPAVVKRRVVVGGDAAKVDSDSVAMTSFAEACLYLASHPEIEVIELAFSSKERIASSLEIGAKRLEIRATPGFTPELVFRPSPDVPQDRRLIRQTLVGSEIAWQGVRIRLEVPSSRSSEWTLFQFSPESTLLLDGCVATIVNSNAGVLQAPQVAFFEPSPAISTTDEEPMVPSQAPHLLVQNSALRGDAVVVRLASDAPLRLSLTNSFVATRDRLLETAGTSTKPRLMDRVELQLDRSTIYAAAGLLASGTRLDFPYRMGVRIDQRNCVVVTNRSSPLLEYRGFEVSEELPLSFKGTDNVYPRSETFFRRMYRHDGLDATESLAIGELPRWASDLDATQLPLSIAMIETASHDQTPADYALKTPSDADAGCSLPSTLLSSGGRTGMGGTMKPDPNMGVTPPMMDDKPIMRTLP